MNTTNTTGGNNYDGPLWSPYLKWDEENEEMDWVAEIEELNEQDNNEDIEFTPENDPYGGY